jgi:superfamily II DNA/RNA helicase
MHPARTLTHAFVDVVVMGVQGDPFLSDCTGLEFLVIDEADRMVETGHFLELKSILTLIQHPASRELIVLPSTSVRCHSAEPIVAPLAAFTRVQHALTPLS